MAALVNWAWFFAGGIAAAIAITLGGIAVVLFLAWTGRRRDHGDDLAEEQAIALTRPAPGASPPRAPEQGPGAPPVPGHYHGPTSFGLFGWRCGCMYAMQITTGQWKQVRECGRPDFNVAEWEARLLDALD